MEDVKYEIERPVNQSPHDWQGKISFERRVHGSKGTESLYPQLPIPGWFVRQHGDKIQKFVTLQAVGDRRMWTVKVTVCFPTKIKWPQAVFSAGWKAFATSAGLVKGDVLRFTLIAISKFEVALLHRGGTLEAMVSALEPEMLSKDPVISGRKRKMPLQPQYIDLNGKISENSESESMESIPEKEPAEEIVAMDFVSNVSDSSPSPSHLEARLHEPQNEQEPRLKSLNDTNCNVQNQIVHPGFLKRSIGSYLELQSAIRRTRQALEEYHSEAAHLMNQRAIVLRLEEQICLQEQQMEAKVKEFLERKQKRPVAENPKET